MNRTLSTARLYWLVVAALASWLIAWIALSWPAIQDDALIHLRYADDLYSHHFITYDGVHPNYGASSLLYVALLALLRGATTSPDLPRAVSSVVHLLLFGGLALALGLNVPRQAKVAKLAALFLLTMLVMPSAVRWLDDGMETGLVVSLVVILAWLIHDDDGSWRRAFMLGGVAFVAVMLRTELLLVCGVGFVILLLDRVASHSAEHISLRTASAIAVGAATAVGTILATMHVLLPDTALAKSHGIDYWFNPIHDTAVTLTGAFSFGDGMLVFWLLTLGLVAARPGLSLRTALANCFCPVVLALSSLRGQEIQGVRYFAWTFVFSIVWNILELSREIENSTSVLKVERRGVVLIYIFAGILAVELPMESLAMRRVLSRRSETMRTFEAQHLEVLRERRGVASDIGYIGYFTGAKICDLAGLVNGRAAARLTSEERVHACAGTKPEFMFLNDSQIRSMAAVMEMTDWKICGEYDFTNVRSPDKHYLLTGPEITDRVCRATGRQPRPVAALDYAGPKLSAQRMEE